MRNQNIVALASMIALGAISSAANAQGYGDDATYSDDGMDAPRITAPAPVDPPVSTANDDRTPAAPEERTTAPQRPVVRWHPSDEAEGQAPVAAQRRQAARPAPSAMSIIEAQALRASLDQVPAVWLGAMDRDGDGTVTRREAIYAWQEAVGGAFFLSDTNHDGRLSPSETRVLREALMEKLPVLRMIAASRPSAETSFGVRQLASYLDARVERTMDVSEVNQAIATGVEALYSMGDLNRDGHMTAAELQGVAKHLGQDAERMAWQGADVDRDGRVSLAEYDAAMVRAARRSFGRMDADRDGVVSVAELGGRASVAVASNAPASPSPAWQRDVAAPPVSQGPATPADLIGPDDAGLPNPEPLDLNRAPDR